MEFRPVSDDDMAAIQTIYAQHALHGLASWELQPLGITELTVRRDTLLGSGLPFVVATVDGELVGYATAGPYLTRPTYRFTVKNTIYLHPDRPGQGIAQPLLQRLIDDCTSRGYRQMSQRSATAVTSPPSAFTKKWASAKSD